MKKHLALAVQGGGSHGAFPWGVLDRLLRPSLEFVSPKQIGAAFLCSPAADQIRGASISVDGGWTAQ